MMSLQTPKRSPRRRGLPKQCLCKPCLRPPRHLPARQQRFRISLKQKCSPRHPRRKRLGPFLPTAPRSSALSRLSLRDSVRLPHHAARCRMGGLLIRSSSKVSSSVPLVVLPGKLPLCRAGRLLQAVRPGSNTVGLPLVDLLRAPADNRSAAAMVLHVP